MRLGILIIGAVAILIALAIGLQGPGAQWGWWDWRQGLGHLRTLAFPSFAASALALVALLLAFWRARGLALFALAAFVVSAAGSYAPLRMKQLADGNPFIHDVTTDFDNPPPIVAGASAPRKNPAAYVGAEPEPQRQGAKPGVTVTIAQAQRDAFPDIRPLELGVDLETAARAARAAIAKMKMETLAEGVDQATGAVLIEAVATSRWFGFKDDFVVRITPKGESAVVVDLRSKSRVGISDLGANAARIRAFTKRLQDELATTGD